MNQEDETIYQPEIDLDSAESEKDDKVESQVKEEFNKMEDIFNDTSIENALRDLSEHLTKEELLCVSLYKKSRKQRNDVYRVFLEEHYGKTLSCSGVSKRKSRTLRVLKAVGALLSYKVSNGIDIRLRRILTRKQYTIVNLYERRITNKEIAKLANISTAKYPWRTVELVWKRAIKRLYAEGDVYIKTYLGLLKNVLRFSAKHPKYRVKLFE
jgi:hypothetical protein